LFLGILYGESSFQVRVNLNQGNENQHTKKAFGKSGSTLPEFDLKGMSIGSFLSLLSLMVMVGDLEIRGRHL
jgi:hypothetical protein